MIVEELKNLAELEQLLADEAYGPQKIHCLIAIDRDGQLLGVIPTLEPRAKGKPQPREFALPSPEGRRASGPRANFLYDKRDYVFDGSADRTRLFREVLDEAIKATDDAGVRAVRAFLERFDQGETKIDFSELPEDATFAFRDIDQPDLLVSDRPRVRDYWRAKRAAGSGERARCVMCGNEGPIAPTHPEIKNVPGGNPAGVAIVSFNNASEWSYGHNKDHRYLNAPFCRHCADAYTRALNRLLVGEPGFLKPDGSRVPGQNYRVSSDTVVVYWSPQSSFAGVFGKVLRGNPAAVHDLFASVKAGRDSSGDPSAFFALVISGAQGRAVIRSMIRSTVAQVAANIRQHFEDLALVPVSPRDDGSSPLHEMLAALKPRGKQAEVAPALAQELLEAAVLGRQYPLSLLDAALRRFRAGYDLSRPRVSIVKAVLNRRRRFGKSKEKEITMALDIENKEPGYRLGRLFAVLERLQGDAINNPNATIVDRFYGAASTTPVVVFPRLLSLAQHHASKSARGGWFQKLIEEIASGIDPNNSFPTLSMEQQGLFAIGYYHQRADMWKKRDTSESSSSKGEM